jgi:hypothetical protein
VAAAAAGDARPRLLIHDPEKEWLTQSQQSQQRNLTRLTLLTLCEAKAVGCAGRADAT